MRHFILPDVQIRPGDDTKFLGSIGRYLVRKQPEIIVCIGDFADMPSLSSYDVGKKSFEGRRYVNDVQAAKDAMTVLLEPIKTFNEKAKKNKEKQYKPRMVMTLGNHEARISRAVEGDAKLDGVLSVDDLQFKEFGWEVYPFLDVVIIGGIAYSHYFVTGVAGRPSGTAAAQLRKANMSSVAGHQQGLQIAMGSRADGKKITSVICGSCYQHDEDYMGPQGNKHWRGALMLYNVDDGDFDLVPVPLDYLVNKYETPAL